MEHCLHAFMLPNELGILITVAQALGSTPRAAGAKMVVTPDRLFDTIGGGHLEWRAIEIARAMLALPTDCTDCLLAERRLERFALGPSLGQCCGGVVQLAFERIEPQGHWQGLHQRWRSGQDTQRWVALDSAAEPTVCDGLGTRLSGPALPVFAKISDEHSAACYLALDACGQRWLFDSCRADRPHVMVFGAGHVGTAIVQALSRLPCQITWVDARNDIFPAILPNNVRSEVTDAPEALIATAAPGSCFLVLTHSHGLDQLLSEHILRRCDFAWFGLIGSQTKRLQFEQRLRQRGIPPEHLSKMVCPIGLPGIHGKAPAIIAASVAAQLLLVWEQLGQI